ncbi:unnamed protein product [Brassica oleracea]
MLHTRLVFRANVCRHLISWHPLSTIPLLSSSDQARESAWELDAAIAEKEKECLKHAAIDTGNLEVLTFHHWFCETVGFVRKTKEHRD